MGCCKRYRSKGLFAKAWAWARAINTVLSAVLYLGDFISTILTLRAYYHYEFVCPHLPQSSDVLQHDPVCRAFAVHSSLHNIGVLFWWCIALLFLGQLTYAVVLYYFSNPHIICIAFMMPFIQLYRLLCVLLRARNTESLTELHREQRHLNSLHTYLVVALESVPQFLMQSFVAMNLGRYVKGSNDPDLQEQQVPKTLMISIIFSLASAMYNAAAAMYFCMDTDHTPWINRLCMSFMVGLETVSSMLEHVICVAALWQHDTDSAFTFPLGVLVFNELALSFLFSSAVVRRHYQHDKEKSACAKFVQAFGLTVVMRVTGPSYVLTLMQKTKAYLICGTFINALGKLACPVFVFLWHKGLRSPCSHTLHEEGTVHIMDRYLNCTVVKATLFVSFLVFALMVLSITWIHKEEGNSNQPKKLPDILCEKHGSFPLECRIPMRLHIITSSTQVIKAAKEPSLFKHFLFLLIFFIIKKFKRT
ncbi:hypothetical protein KP509_25G026100 [Ceratopteris richardii]|uniref:Uncharacterized protein n=1 Tax=Ceratopteris richardii TaxID=49495 RepID=A0A8T2RNL1_CERRI|nr:hypothetical protein KP509_25G026100 [Ceratopteris richardii]